MHAVTLSPEIVKSIKLSKLYGGKAVVNELDLTIDSGCFCGILGPNGAGKTTTLRMLVGHCPIDSGELSILGLPANQPYNANKNRDLTT